MSTFTVETKRRRSTAGDGIRQGRVADGADRHDAAPIALAFEDRADGCCYCMLAAAEVGVICSIAAAHGRAPGFTWLCWLPGNRTTPQFAASRDKAEGAMRRAVEMWCELAKLTTRPARPRRRAVQGWRS